MTHPITDADEVPSNTAPAQHATPPATPGLARSERQHEEQLTPALQPKSQHPGKRLTVMSLGCSYASCALVCMRAGWHRTAPLTAEVLKLERHVLRQLQSQLLLLIPLQRTGPCHPASS